MTTAFDIRRAIRCDQRVAALNLLEEYNKEQDQKRTMTMVVSGLIGALVGALTVWLC